MVRMVRSLADRTFRLWPPPRGAGRRGSGRGFRPRRGGAAGSRRPGRARATAPRTYRWLRSFTGVREKVQRMSKASKYNVWPVYQVPRGPRASRAVSISKLHENKITAQPSSQIFGQCDEGESIGAVSARRKASALRVRSWRTSAWWTRWLRRPTPMPARHEISFRQMLRWLYNYVTL